MRSWLRRLYLFLTLWLLWLLFAGTTDPQEVAVGALLSLGLALGLSDSLAGTGEAPPSTHSLGERIQAAVLYVPYLCWAILQSNLDVAGRVLSPVLDIRPGLVKVRTRLKHPVARMILANSITLTPGTLTVDLVGEDLYVHWVSVEVDDIEAATEAICAGFEKYLEVIFD